MDPFSIVGGTTALIGQIAKVAKVLHDLHTTLKDAPRLLASIMTECTVMRTTLCALEDMQNRRDNRISFISEQIFHSFNTAMACCEVIMTDLEKDAQTCLKAGRDPSDKDAIRRCNIILSKDHLQELLMQLNGQKQAIQLLLTTWQSRDAEQMRRREEDNRDVLRGIARRVIRRYTTDDDSSAQSSNSSEKFAFDQELLSSPRYQRAIRYLRKMESRQTELRGSTLEPESEPIGLGISHLPDEHSSVVPESSVDTDSLHFLSRQDSAMEPPETPVINVSCHSGEQDVSPTEQNSRMADICSFKPVADDIPVLRTFTYKRRSMPPLFSQIQAVAMSPDALLGVVARSQRHRRARSEGHEAMSTPSRTAYAFQSPTSSTFTFHDSAISDVGYTLDDASKDDFNADFDEFWVHQAHRETYRSFPIPSRKVVFLGDSCIRPLWSNMQATPSPGARDDDKDQGDSRSLRVAIDNVVFDLNLIDMTGDHQDFAAALLEPEAHIAVIAYAIDNPYSLQDVLNKWAVIVRDIHTSLPLFLLGWSRETRTNASTIKWLSGMSQMPVSYSEGAAVFRSLCAEAFLEIDSNDKSEAIEFFETLSKTLIRLHHDELRSITQIDLENERIRLSPSNPMFFRDPSPPKFTILPQEEIRIYQASHICELAAKSEPATRDSTITNEVFPDAELSKQELSELLTERKKDVKDGELMIASKKLEPEAVLDPAGPIPEILDASIEFDQGVSSVEHNLNPSHEPKTPRASCTPRKAVLLRIDSELSQKYRPKEIHIIKPQNQEAVPTVHRDTDSSPEGFTPDKTLEQYDQDHTASESKVNTEPADSSAAIPSIHKCARCEDSNLKTSDDSNEYNDDDDNDTDLLNIPGAGTKRQPADSPYILPDLPEFEALTPKLMEFLFTGDLETT